MLDMIKGTLEQIFASYSQYFGFSMYLLLFFIASIYLFITEKGKDNFVLLSEYSLLVLLVIFNPLIAKWIIASIDDSVYWRIFWILPLTMVIAYVATAVIQHIKDRGSKFIVTIALLLVVAFSGKFIYSTENYSETSNWYKLPQQTIEICEILHNDCNGVIRVVVPPSLETTIRQYDADIYMVYGREGGVNSHYSDNKERDAMRNLMLVDELNVPSIYSSMELFDCNYLILYNTTTLSDNLESYGFELVTSIDIYNIYRLETM